ncbi:MAG: hypothetical protein QOH43_1185 [Solirubrobacteraceae bacterium]|jgi:uncharacterized protein|nr:hypothetical protein [Solirubrobacteraceae bacterium]
MPARTDTFDLAPLKLAAGEARRIELETPLGPFDLGESTYAVNPNPVPVVLDISRMTGQGYALRLRFSAALEGPCMRCLEPAAPRIDVDAREVEQPGGGEELDSPYVVGELLDVAQWANDAFVLAMPVLVVCREDCAGLCPECGANLNAEPGHAHERPPDPRWAKLRELKLE